MSSKSYNECCFPITNWMCDEAEANCLNEPAPGHRHEQSCCCSSRGDICCVDCFYCLSPLGLVIDILCFPINMYDNCKKEQDTNLAIAI